MAQTTSAGERRSYWFVDAAFGEAGDQTDRFVADGVWENGYPDRYLDDVRSIRPGDRIAIKATYNQKHGLPFDNRGSPVAVMEIRAVGEVAENMDDGRRLKVDWQPVGPPRKWYFYTNPGNKIWKVEHGRGRSFYGASALIRFAFQGEKQNIGHFRNRSIWAERFGDGQRFAWTFFYSEVADKLLPFRGDRGPLISELLKIARGLGMTFLSHDRFEDGTQGDLRDICPFSTFGCFNRSMADAKRVFFARELAHVLKMRESVPTLNTDEDGIPTLDPMRTWFFSHQKDRKPDDIDVLWTLFADAMKLSRRDESAEGDRAAFVRSYDNAVDVKGVGVTTLSIGLYWIRPWDFPPLDKYSRKYIEDQLGCRVPENPSGQEYLELTDTLQERFHASTPVDSFPELSWRAYRGNGPPPYTIDSILADGCFLPRKVLGKALGRLRSRKNLILQGPPGTGKTWLAKRLAFALLGEKEPGRVRHLQFHPNLSYEDFVRGHRPVDGQLELTDGPFLKVMEEARNDPDRDYVLVIEEINRGNPAQIFGEMLTLLEADKRTPEQALALAFPRDEQERVHVPPNVYLVGTMNVADRSLALVDLALRRRFAFVDLEPIFGAPWREWMREQGGFDDGFLQQVAERMDALNKVVSADTGLGAQFRVGHSYLTVPPDTQVDDPQQWFREVVETEIAPLLREYWFDRTDKADAQEKTLLADF